MVIVYLHYSHLPLNDQVYWAALDGRTEEVVRLLGEGADPNWQNVFGWTALHVACVYNRHQILTILINSNANIISRIDIRTHHSTSPVWMDPLSV